MPSQRGKSSGHTTFYAVRLGVPLHYEGSSASLPLVTKACAPFLTVVLSLREYLSSRLRLDRPNPLLHLPAASDTPHHSLPFFLLLFFSLPFLCLNFPFCLSLVFCLLASHFCSYASHFLSFSVPSLRLHRPLFCSHYLCFLFSPIL